MPSNNVLTREELLFLKRIDGLAVYFDKIRAAKKLIAEAQTEMSWFVRSIAPSKPAKSSKPAKAKNIEYGADLPDALSDVERKVYAELQKAGIAGRAPRGLAEALKISIGTVSRVTASLKKRKLISVTGETVNRTWKVGR